MTPEAFHASRVLAFLLAASIAVAMIVVAAAAITHGLSTVQWPS